METSNKYASLTAIAVVAMAFFVSGCGNNPPPTTHPDAAIINTANEGAAQATSGKAIFASAGCASCHTFAPAGSTATIGPNLGEISKEGPKVVKTAIVDPNTEIAPGYKKGVMPTDFGTRLSAAEMAALVAFVAQTKGQGPATAATSTSAPDGKAIFVSAGCASCHTFAKAGSSRNATAS